MNKYYLIFLLLISINQLSSQELNCKVTVNSSRISGSNKQVFSTLEKALTDYMNNTKWTDKVYKKQEQIQCALSINIIEQSSSTQFKGNVQIQVVRPVFNSTYLTSTLNYQDEDVDFVYEEFQPLVFNETTYESNLISLFSFYAYIILGIDADTFALNGGDEYFKKAESILLTAQQGNHKGWNSIDGNKTRFQLIDNLLNATYKSYRSMLYNYHLKGLDVMSNNQIKAKNTIANAIVSLKNIYSRRPNAFLLRIFLDTKVDEIETIFKGGKQINTMKLKEMLMRVYPARNNNWNNIK